MILSKTIKKIKMKRQLLFIIALLCTVFTMFSCSNDDDENTDAYYIKYEACVTANTDEAQNIVGLATPAGNAYSTIIGSTNSWQATYGPVSKGFEASMTASRFENSSYHTFRISVSKNNSPFVVKKEGNYITMKYVVGD